MSSKTDAILEREEIRDAFDIEFLHQRGIPLVSDREKLEKIRRVLDGFIREDYTVKLGSLLAEEERRYYVSQGFRVLHDAISRAVG